MCACDVRAPAWCPSCMQRELGKLSAERTQDRTRNASWVKFALGMLLLAGTVSACVSVKPQPQDPRIARLQRTVNRVAQMYNMPNPPTVLTDAHPCVVGV